MRCILTPTPHPLFLMYDLQLNESGTRHLTLSDTHLATIERYALLRDLVDSTGYVTEDVLEKLRQNVRALIAHSTENSKDLLDLCIDVIYHEKMKAFGLKQLILLYVEWESRRHESPNA